VRRLGEERDRVREVSANGLDYREAPENQQRNEQPALTGLMSMRVRTVAMAVPVAVTVSMPMSVLMFRICAVASVIVIAVGLVRVRHGLGNPVSGCILKTL
jgi:hypothetical protein